MDRPRLRRRRRRARIQQRNILLRPGQDPSLALEPRLRRGHPRQRHDLLVHRRTQQLRQARRRHHRHRLHPRRLPQGDPLRPARHHTLLRLTRRLRQGRLLLRRALRPLHQHLRHADQGQPRQLARRPLRRPVQGRRQVHRQRRPHLLHPQTPDRHHHLRLERRSHHTRLRVGGHLGTQAALPRPGRHRRLHGPVALARRDQAHRQARHRTLPRPGQVHPPLPAQPRRRRLGQHPLARQTTPADRDLRGRSTNSRHLRRGRLRRRADHAQGRREHQALLPRLLVTQRRQDTNPRLVPEIPGHSRQHLRSFRRLGVGPAHLPVLRRRSLALQRRPDDTGQGTHLVHLARLQQGHPPHR